MASVAECGLGLNASPNVDTLTTFRYGFNAASCTELAGRLGNFV